MNIKVGDKVVRKMHGTRDRIWHFDGIVTDVTSTIITVDVMVDVMRSMQFNRSDGVNCYGKEYGWIEKVES